MTLTRCEPTLEHTLLGHSLAHCHALAAAGSRTCRFVTVIRHPIDRTSSAWRHCLASWLPEVPEEYL